jgi:hypothetical protein
MSCAKDLLQQSLLPPWLPTRGKPTYGPGHRQSHDTLRLPQRTPAMQVVQQCAGIEVKPSFSHLVPTSIKPVFMIAHVALSYGLLAPRGASGPNARDSMSHSAITRRLNKRVCREQLRRAPHLLHETISHVQRCRSVTGRFIMVQDFDKVTVSSGGAPWRKRQTRRCSCTPLRDC